MLRRLFTLVAALSLLMCVAAAVAYLCTRQRTQVVGLEQVALSGNDGQYSALYLACTGYGLEAGRWATLSPNPDNIAWYKAHRTRGWRWFHADRQFGVFSGLKRDLSFWERLGFNHTYLRQRTWDENATRIVCLTRHDAVSVPWWFIVGLTILLPAAHATQWLSRWRKRSLRRASGLCLYCGYDLRASTNKCPECGSPIPATGVKTSAP